MALIAQAATLESRIPFLHFFDGFRTSHEVAKIEQLTADDLRAMIDDDLVRAHRAAGALAGPPGDPRHGAEPGRLLPGARDASTRSTSRRPTIVQNAMDKFAEHRGPAVSPVRLRRRAGRRARDRDDGLGRGSGRGDGGSADCATGEKVGLLKVRLYRPFAIEAFVAALPATVKIDRGARPHQGAGRRGRAALLRRGHRAGGDGRQIEEGDRRALRPVFQGIHAGHGEGRLRRAGEDRRRRTTSPSASTTT